MALSVAAPRARRRKPRGGGAAGRGRSRGGGGGGSRLGGGTSRRATSGAAGGPSSRRRPSAASSRVGGGGAPARPVSETIKEVERMERAGNLDGLVDYVQRYQADADTVRAAMQALTEYCLKRPTSEDAAVQILESGGVEAVVSVMRLHIADETVGTMCAIALRTIADTAENRVAMVEAGGVAAIAEALRLHGDNGELVKWCAAALRNLVDPVHVANGVLSVEQADFCVQTIIEEGVIGALVNALHAVQKADAVAKSGAAARSAEMRGGGGTTLGDSSEEELEELGDVPPVDDLPAAVDHFKAVRVLVLTMRTLAVGNYEVQAKLVVAVRLPLPSVSLSLSLSRPPRSPPSTWVLSVSQPARAITTPHGWTSHHPPL
eukprot:COSAG01_NODE_4646_length_4853_cov_70.544594_3_plen_377_part_00